MGHSTSYAPTILGGSEAHVDTKSYVLVKNEHVVF
jgi:hypothetical protein